MPRRNVVIEGLSPLLLGGGSAADNLQVSLRYVSGSAWRGAAAGAVLHGLERHRHAGRPVVDGAPDPAFAAAFLGDVPARFGFLYPVRRRADQLAGVEALPIPLTALTCKRDDGFPPEGHGVYDTLARELRRAAGAAPAARPATCPAPDCKGRLERMRGFMRRAASQDRAGYVGVRLEPRSFVRVGLNRRTETAQDQLLYVLDALVPGGGLADDAPEDEREQAESEPPLSFVGSWWGSDAQWRALAELLDAHVLPEDGGYRLTIGADRARGMGRVRLRLSGPAGSSGPALDYRLDQFQPRRDGRLLDPDHCYAALDLRAPLLLLDARGLPARGVSAEILRAYHPAAPAGLELLDAASAVERETAAGWSSAWGLPKPAMPAFAAGGVLALRAPAAERAALLAYLAELEESGLGERTAEGWGEVLACDPFHVLFDDDR